MTTNAATTSTSESDREALLKVLMDEYGETKDVWTALGSFQRVVAVVDRIAAKRAADVTEQLAAQTAAMRALAGEYESGEYSAVDVGERINDYLDGVPWGPR